MKIPASGKKRSRKHMESIPPLLKKKKNEHGETTTAMNVDSTASTDLTKKRHKKPNKSEPTVSKQPRKKSVVSSKMSLNKGKKKKVNEEDDDENVEDLEMSDFEDSEEEEEIDIPNKKKFIRKPVYQSHSVCKLTGEPVPAEQARGRWRHRYDDTSKASKGGKDYLRVQMHYSSANVDGDRFSLNDFCVVKAGEGHRDYVGRILEFFETTTKNQYVSVKWFFRAEETVIKNHSNRIEERRLFASDSINDIALDCLIGKTSIVQASEKDPLYEYFYDMLYSEKFCTFNNLQTENEPEVSSSASTSKGSLKVVEEPSSESDSTESIMTLLDLYAGCGGMSTGLCMGTAMSGVYLVTRWAVDNNEDACRSLRYNHPETEVRHEEAEDFLSLLKEWQTLCASYSLVGTQYFRTKQPTVNDDDIQETTEDAETRPPHDGGVYEVEKIIGICYGDPNKKNKPRLHFKVKWKGYGSNEDSWEPMSKLKNCMESVEDFVREGYKYSILPLPGTVDVICGGPPCQGVSGFNRNRDAEKPMEDPKNNQVKVVMDIVQFLQPRYTLMENVVDILKFVDGTLGRYAICRLVEMGYQARLGLLVAGGFGLPQYRMRAFLWGSQATETLPQFPLPTHKAIRRGYPPKEFERNLVVGDEKVLLKALVLGDAISDLPEISTHETRDERDYGKFLPATDFQRKIRSPKCVDLQTSGSGMHKLYDHVPLPLSEDDNHRVSLIPPKKGANFRDLPGVIVENKVAKLDPTMDRIYLKSEKPLVPDYALNYGDGKSTKPFGRLSMDETIGTVVTRAEPHNQIILHPTQNRVLSVRENARLQGFPDWYRFFGKVKQRYVQIGNAVAVPVGQALGYTLAMASQGISDGGQVVALPPSFSGLGRFRLQYRRRFRLKYRRNRK
ncbi:hypothetical protein MKX03_021180 [Papaver bracteatum]|nr:hypothetical protein MKX03_021180 [Papaver bracteatum]